MGGTSLGKLVFWNTKSGVQINAVASEKESMICGIDWNPTEKDEIAFIKEDGYWGVVNKFLSASINDNEKALLNDENLNEDELAAALFDDDDDDDNENSFSIRRIKKETGFLEEEDDETTNQSAPPKEDTEVEAAPIQQQSHVISTPSIDLQEPFQPGSTPVHLESRFMVWNSVGIVRAFNSEEENSIDIEFHDVSTHHPIHIGNSHGYTMADLSNEAVVLASEADEAEGSNVASKLTCHHFGASGLNKEWSIDMPENEDIMAVACGFGWVAVATDRR